MPQLTTPLVPDRWRWLFAVEVPICFATAAWWVLAPGDFLALSFGVAPSPGAVLLVRQLAGVLFSLLVWTYGRWLFSGRVELRPFRFLQEGLLFGDVFLVLEGLVAFGLPGASPAAALGQIGMAALWGIVRIVFLARNTLR